MHPEDLVLMILCGMLWLPSITKILEVVLPSRGFTGSAGPVLYEAQISKIGGMTLIAFKSRSSSSQSHSPKSIPEPCDLCFFPEEELASVQWHGYRACFNIIDTLHVSESTR